MINIQKYRDGVVSFYCSRCDKHYEVEISDMLEDNCALDIDIVCPACCDTGILFFLKCKDEYLSKSLNAELMVLKENRYKIDVD